MGCDEGVNHHTTDCRGSLAVRPVLESTERRRTGKRLITLHGRLKGDVMPQCLVIIQVFIPQSQSIHPQPNQRTQPVVASAFHAIVVEKLADAIDQMKTTVRLPQKQTAAITGDLTPAKINLNLA
jgi:hypothetical protein